MKNEKDKDESGAETIRVKDEMPDDFPGSPECYLAEKKQFERHI